MCVCVRYQIRVPVKRHIKPLTSVNLTSCCIKHNQGSSGTKLPRLDMSCRFILSLSKIAHQMWRDHPIQPKEQTTERAVGVVVAADREVEGWGWTKFEKEGEG